MVLLIEQERQLASESGIYSSANYNFPTSFGTVLSTGVTSITGQFMVYSVTVKNTDSVARTFQLRMKFDGNIIFATGDAISLVAGASVTYAGAIYLPPANHTVTFEGKASAASVVQLQNMQLGACSFNDQAVASATPYTASLTPAVPPARVTPIGETAYTTVIIRVGASTPGAVTNMENIGETSTNGVNVSVGGSQLGWMERFQDSDGGNLNGASGLIMFQAPLTLSSWEIAVSKRNANTVVNISIITCPWLLVDRASFPSAVFPVAALDFPQGSILYCNLEPLFLDVSKDFLVGKRRAISFGDATDFYYYPSGTGLLECNYTFEIPDVSTVGLAAFGWGGCVNQIGCDTR